MKDNEKKKKRRQLNKIMDAGMLLLNVRCVRENDLRLKKIVAFRVNRDVILTKQMDKFGSHSLYHR